MPRIRKEAEAPETDAPAERIAGKVLWGNVWSSERKHLRGDVYEFTAEDFAILDAADAIKRA